MADIGYEKCPCGHYACSTYFLTGTGSFVYGSGFTLEEAKRIVSALNAADALLTFAEDQAARMNAEPDPRPPTGDDWNDLFAEVMALKTAPDFATLRAKIMVQYPKTLEYLAAPDEKEITALEALRPVWAQGYSDDSVAAQVTSAALADLWRMLGASNQTDAAARLQALHADNRALRTKLANAEAAIDVYVSGMKAAHDRCTRLEEKLREAREWVDDIAMTWGSPRAARDLLEEIDNLLNP